MNEIFLQIETVFPLGLALNLALIFILNASSVCLGTLKTLFLNKRFMHPAYLTTFLDALICGYAFKMIASSSGLAFLLAFGLGRIFGVYLGGWIDRKLALGTVEVSVYKEDFDEGIKTADRLRALGFPVTTGKGYGIEGKERMILNIIIKRKDLCELQEVLAGYGGVNAVVRDVDSAMGKIVKPLAPLDTARNNLIYP